MPYIDDLTSSLFGGSTRFCASCLWQYVRFCYGFCHL
jgi:hypothetical protein